MSCNKISLMTKIILKTDCSFLVLFEFLLTPVQVQQRRLSVDLFYMHTSIVKINGNTTKWSSGVEGTGKDRAWRRWKAQRPGSLSFGLSSATISWIDHKCHGVSGPQSIKWKSWAEWSLGLFPGINPKSLRGFNIFS